jgi:hypothetical protein
MATANSLNEERKQRQVVTKNKEIYSSKKSYDLFLSHSYLDKKLVYTLVDIFNKAGYNIYVDWMVDTQLDRTVVNRETAKVLKGRMDDCKGLAYVSTSNTVNSKWCPWELGYSDGSKNGRCAILPIMETEYGEFKGREYLGLYPYIDYEKNRSAHDYDFWVNDPQNEKKYINLSSWLEGNDLTIHE